MNRKKISVCLKLISMIGELLAFDDAVSIVRNWIDADPYRHQNTLLIVVADYETGGVIINGPYGTMNAPGDSNVQAESLDVVVFINFEQKN